MTSGIPSGLGATLGFAQETAVGTFTTPTRFLQFDSETLLLKKKTVQSTGLHGGYYEQATRRAYTTRTVNGGVTMDLQDRQLGLLLAHMLGSSATAVQQGATTAYLQTHTPGSTLGKSLTVQVGRPQTNGTITPFSYTGLKVTDWEISAAVDQIGKLTLTLDGWDESTASAYAAPSYVAANVLHFAQASLLIGGTVTTSAGVASVTGATTAAAVKSASIKGTNGLDVSRYFLGASGLKAEQLANGFRKISGSAEVEFANLTDVYNAFSADTQLALQLTYTGKTIATGYPAELNILVPAIYFDSGPPNVSGPGVLTQKVTFTGLDDTINPPIQIQYQSADTAV